MQLVATRQSKLFRKVSHVKKQLSEFPIKYS